MFLAFSSTSFWGAARESASWFWEKESETYWRSTVGGSGPVPGSPALVSR